MESNSNLNSNIIVLREHQPIDEKDIPSILELGISFCETNINEAPKFLGIKPNYFSSYFIGADWLDAIKDRAIVILPKMDNIDFIEMFMCALEFEPASEYFSKIYSIDFEKKQIVQSDLNKHLTPLLIFHYLSMIKRVVKRGLKKDYIIREENLNAKIKGHIKIARNTRTNDLIKRYDKIFCQFHEYSIDSHENRLLKKAILFAKAYINKMKAHSSYGQLNSLINSLLPHFENVSDDLEIYQIRKISSNKIFKEYNEAIRIAKLILKRFSYSINEIENPNMSTPAFWIDMSRLYEVYVYSLLYKAYGKVIIFQEPGYHKTVVDFLKLDEQLVMDTKYKPHYEGSNAGIIDDIRQISGYARDEKILSCLLNNDKQIDFVPPCLIIYPEKQEDSDIIISKFDSSKLLLQMSKKISGFRKFYKISVPLPINRDS